MDFQVTNTGTIRFETISLTVTDPSTGTSRTLLSDDFTNRNGCGTATTLDTFDPGITHIVSSTAFTYDPSGHELNARILLCASPGPSGMCITQEVDFTP